MAVCKTCGQEMMDPDTTSCTYQVVKIGGKWYPRDVKYYDVNDRCHDCNIVNRFPNRHHPGCDMERCPVCGGQSISCDCPHDGMLGKTDPCPECGGLLMLPNETHGTLFCRDCGAIVLDAGSLPEHLKEGTR